MQLLLLPDRHGWSYYSIAESIKNHSKDLGIFTTIKCIKSQKDSIKANYGRYDEIFAMGWQTTEKLGIDNSKLITGVHSHRSFDNGKTQPDKDFTPPAEFIDNLRTYKRINTISKRLYKLLNGYGLNLSYTPNGIDTKFFNPGRNGDKTFTIGYSGSHAHDDLKGVSQFIIPAAKKAGVRFKTAMLNTDTYLTHDKMPDFYKKIDIYICASSSEGSSISVLEAAASGKPVISTRVGECTEIIKDGFNGFLVDRNIDAIADKISILKNDDNLLYDMSRNIREKIEIEYSWKKVISSWVHFIKGF